MRIISEFHDYYDAVQGMGQDSTLIYQRKQFTTPLKDMLLEEIRNIGHNHHSFGVFTKGHIIGFCGKIYPVLFIQSVKKKTKQLCHSLEEVDSFIMSNFKKKDIERYTGKKWKYDNSWGYNQRQDSIKKFFLEAREKRDSFHSLFIQHKSPIFVYKSDKGYFDKLFWNEGLKDLEFYRIMEPYTAFQELQMFMSNIAMPEKEIPVPSDETMAEIKGFDKWSFRKEPKGK